MHNAVIKAGQIEVKAAEWVEYQSAGHLLIIAEAAAVEAIALRCAPLQLTAVTTDNRKPDTTVELTWRNAPLESLTGWLGNFKAQIAGEPHTFDLVLDLTESPHLPQTVSPLGYFAPGDDQQALVEALQQLPDLVGEFDKPKFFNYKASICAHSRRGIQACNQCVEACPAEAIHSAGDLVSINTSLCQGCGSCVAVCPSGAMTYALPTLDLSLERLRDMLKVYFSLETAAPHLLIHDEQVGQQLVAVMQSQFGQQVIAFSIEEVGALSLPFWLAAIAYGVGNITVWDAGSHRDHEWQELQQQIALTNELLNGMGYANAVHWFSGQDRGVLLSQLKQAASVSITERAQFAGLDDKRRVSTLALSHLHAVAPTPTEVLALQPNAPFGEVNVDTQGCTLCMSCVSVCPVGALVDGVDKPQLNFIEDLCVQCGMCEMACPENVISLSPRYVFSRDVARQKRVLHEEPIFNCIRCQKPFATQKMIDTITEKLKNHHMFQGDKLEHLKMCEDCRVKAQFK